LSDENSQGVLSGLSQEQMLVLSIFQPYSLERIKHALINKTRFVHYTTADTAVRILENEQIWLRKCSCMNDFMEVEHGFECLNSAYKKNQELVKATLDALFPNIQDRLQKLFNSWLPHFRTGTYIACVSEHGNPTVGEEEDQIGRLSMWRAYGGKTGVAIVMNNGPFLRSTDALRAYTSPVAYISAEAFELEFIKLFESIKSNHSALLNFGEEYVLEQLFSSFKSAVLCSKHPGFREEREWRVIYSPALAKSDRLLADVKSIGGTPQPIYKLPLKNVIDENLFGIELNQLIERVIIGPTSFPQAIREAIVLKLKEKNVEDAERKVIVSDIPLRH
jgi:Protein of unknown function (DUF2971)